MKTNFNSLGKWNLIFILCLSFPLISQAKKNGYFIQAEISHVQDSILQLCHYNGRPGLVVIDSIIKVKVGQPCKVKFSTAKNVNGGLYMLLFKNKRSQLELILNDGDSISVAYDFDRPSETAVIKGSQECIDYLDYQKMMQRIGPKFQQLEEQKRQAKTKADSTNAAQRIKELMNEADQFKAQYANRNPTGFMTKLFKASAYKEMPATIKGNKEKENEFIRQYIFEGFDFNDDRLAFTPFLENKLGAYLSAVPQVADTVNLLSDQLLSRMKKGGELYKLTVDWLVKTQENVKVKFGDDCFIYIVEKYYLNGAANWITDSTRQSYQKKIALLSQNVIGAHASDIHILNKNDQATSLQSIYSAHRYTVLMFWSPSCNHCTDELPKLDSAVASLKKDIMMVGVDAHNEGNEWKKYIDSHTFKAPWTHLYDPNRKGHFVSDYSVYTTPVLYLINQQGTIVGKRITHNNIKEMIDDIEKNAHK